MSISAFSIIVLSLIHSHGIWLAGRNPVCVDWSRPDIQRNSTCTTRCYPEGHRPFRSRPGTHFPVWVYAKVAMQQQDKCSALRIASPRLTLSQRTTALFMICKCDPSNNTVVESTWFDTGGRPPNTTTKNIHTPFEVLGK